MKDKAFFNFVSKQDKQKTGFTFQDKDFSYQDILDISATLSTAMNKKCLQGQMVGFWMPNCPDLIFSYLACFQSQVIPVPVNTESTLSELVRILKQTKLNTLILTQDKINLITPKDLEGTEVDEVWLIEGGKISLLHQIRSTSEVDFITHDSFLNLALVLHTSGSSGLAKSVCIDQHALVQIIQGRIDLAQITHDSRALVASNLSHSVGLYQVLALLSVGAYFELLTGYDSNTMVMKLNQSIPTHLILVVSAFHAILNHPDTNQDTFSQIKFASVGADRVTQSIQDKYFTLTGNYLAISYGLTEQSWVLFHQPKNRHQSLALGMPTPGTQIDIRDQYGNTVETGQVGELYAKSKRMSADYLDENRADLSKQHMHSKWMKTGDLVYQDQSNLIWYAGRCTNLVVTSSGDNIYPFEIEKEIQSIKGVVQCLVIGLRDEDEFEQPCAFIQLKPSIKPTRLLEQISTHLNRALSQYKHPKHFYLLESIPCGPTGKWSPNDLKKKWSQSNPESLIKL